MGRGSAGRGQWGLLRTPLAEANAGGRRRKEGATPPHRAVQIHRWQISEQGTYPNKPGHLGRQRENGQKGRAHHRRPPDQASLNAHTDRPTLLRVQRPNSQPSGRPPCFSPTLLARAGGQRPPLAWPVILGSSSGEGQALTLQGPGAGRGRGASEVLTPLSHHHLTGGGQGKDSVLPGPTPKLLEPLYPSLGRDRCQETNADRHPLHLVTPTRGAGEGPLSMQKGGNRLRKH